MNVIDVANWPADEYVVYPEGARDKSLIYCPENLPEKFLRPGHPYLFKHSNSNYPEQYWVEIFAFHLGKLIDITVPPAYVAFDSDTNQSAALIEWFMKSVTNIQEKKQSLRGRVLLAAVNVVLRVLPINVVRKVFDQIIEKNGEAIERYVSGGDVMQRMIKNYDRKKGKQHNLESIMKYFHALEKAVDLQDGWIKEWAKMLTFDALIGNTDRHQDNWGLIWKYSPGGKIHVRMTPVFDNGTSMGHEMLPNKFHLFDDDAYIERYVLKGRHHMKMNLRDGGRCNHGELLLKMMSRYPSIKSAMLNVLNFTGSDADMILRELTGCNVPVPLSINRAEFMLKLLLYRRDHLLLVMNS